MSEPLPAVRPVSLCSAADSVRAVCAEIPCRPARLRTDRVCTPTSLACCDHECHRPHHRHLKLRAPGRTEFVCGTEGITGCGAQQDTAGPVKLAGCQCHRPISLSSATRGHELKLCYLRQRRENPLVRCQVICRRTRFSAGLLTAGCRRPCRGLSTVSVPPPGAKQPVGCPCRGLSSLSVAPAGG
jgi:hypothetical protein